MIEYKHTAEDLREMQAWSLNRKIQVTQMRIIEFYERLNGNVYISFSGGKDSTVLLDLARRCYPDITAVFCDTGLEYPEVRKFALSREKITRIKPEMRFDEVIKEYGWCFPSKDVAIAIYAAKRGVRFGLNYFEGLNADGTESYYKKTHYPQWKFLVDSPVKISDKCCYYMKEKPFNRFARETKKVKIVGTMADESYRRKTGWFKTGCNVFEKGKQASKPLSFWTEQDILQYLHDYKIPYASVYGDIIEDEKGRLTTTGEKRTGCMFCPVGCHLEKPNKFQRMQITHPKLWKYVIYDLALHELLDYVGVPYKADTETLSQTGEINLFNKNEQ